MDLLERMYDLVLCKMDMKHEMEDMELTRLIHKVLNNTCKTEYIPLQVKIKTGRELFNAFRKLDILQELIEDDEITEIMINGTSNIFLEKNGVINESDKRFVSSTRLEDVIQQIVSKINRYVNEASPIVDARLEDGSRVNVVLKPVAINGPILTIRKFPKEKLTMERLVESESITNEAAEFLKKAVVSKLNIFISGGTGSGKTTFLNALSDYIPSDERLITIEDNAELQITGIRNLVRLEARNSNIEGQGEITISDLLKSALRMRPDRIIVGEVRGKEVMDMINSMLNGHSGSMSTGHGNNVRDMLKRLEVLMTSAELNVPLEAVRGQIASALDIIIHLGRLRDKSRKVLEISEIIDVKDGEIKTNVLYEFQEEGVENEKITGRLVKKNNLYRQEKFVAAGYKEV